MLLARSDSVDEESNVEINDCPEMISFDNGISRGKYVNNTNVHLFLDQYLAFCTNNTVRSYNVASCNGYSTATNVTPRNNGYGFIIGGCVALKVFCGSTSPITYVPINDSTLFVTYSSMKFPIKLLHTVAVSEKIYKADDKISGDWVAFGTNGKANITYEHVMSHSDGLQAILPITSAMLTADNYNRSAVEAVILGTTPEYTPGTHFGYSPNTFGWIADSILLKAYESKGFYGKNLTVLFEEKFGQKLRAAGMKFEFYFGITPSQESTLGPRVALVRPGTQITKMDPNYIALLGLLGTPGSFQNRILFNPADLIFNAAIGVYDQNPLNVNKNKYAPHAWGYTTLESMMNLATIASLNGKAKVNGTKVEFYKKSAKKSFENIFNGTDYVDLYTKAYTRNGIWKKNSKYMQQFTDTAFGHPGAPGNEIIIDSRHPCGPLAVVSLQADYDGQPDDSLQSIYFKEMTNIALSVYCADD